MGIWSITDGDVYVDGLNGSDLDGDGSINNPYATIQEGISNASYSISTLDNTPGQYKLVIAAGTYEENVFYQGGGADVNIIGDGLVILDGDGEFALGGDGLELRRVSPFSPVVVENLVVKNYDYLIMGPLWAITYRGVDFQRCTFINGGIYNSTRMNSNTITSDVDAPFMRYCTFNGVAFDSGGGSNGGSIAQSILRNVVNCNLRNCSYSHIQATYPTHGAILTNCDVDENFVNVYGTKIGFINCNVRSSNTGNIVSNFNPVSGDPLYNNLNEDDFTYQVNSPNLNSGQNGRNVGAKGYAPVAAAGNASPLTLAGGAIHTNISEIAGNFFLNDSLIAGTIESANIDLNIERSIGKINFLSGDDFDVFKIDSQGSSASLYSYELKWGSDEVSMAASDYKHMKVGEQPKHDGTYGNGDINFTSPGTPIIARWLKVKITINP